MYRPHENLDEYEDEDDYEEEDGEVYEEEEAPRPCKEELDFLEIRQKIKESLRKQMKKENGPLAGKPQDKTTKFPYDNYGSFFGPSQPAIAQRVIQERKSLQETQHLASRTSNTHNGSGKNLSGARLGVSKPQPRPMDRAKLKAEILKSQRDYTFLFSDDAELPAPTKEAPRNVSVPKSDARSTQGPFRSKVPVSDHGKTVSSSSQRKLLPSNRPFPKASSNKVAPQNRPSISSGDPRKKLANGSARGSTQPMASKGSVPKMAAQRKLPASSKASAPIMERKGSSMGVKKPISNPPKAPLPVPHSSLQKRIPEPKRALQQPDRARPISKPPLSVSKAQIKPPKARLEVNHTKKRPNRPFFDEDEDEDDPQAIIRKMFRYDPRKFAGVDEDDSDMEANFDDIMEEEHRSEMIGKREDEIQLKLIEEEERREEEARRRRLEAKRRKRQ